MYGTTKDWKDKATLKKKSKAGGITIPHFKLYYNQWTRVENQEMNSQLWGQLIFDKAGKNIQWNTVSSASGAGKTGQRHAEEFLHCTQK